jgi:lipopolysaccharide/colanic/teichoic acid biosynthesis glycosyltransferase
MNMNSIDDQNQSEEMIPSNSVQIPDWKRALDIAVIIVALPLLLPLAVLIGLVIWLVSTGPILFKQERVGHRGKRFMCYKFRTMKVGAETASHQWHLNQLMTSNAPMVKMDAQGDPRVIPGGSLIRSSGLDELPQLINVLFGEMSLVGPRPCVPYEYENYLPEQKERFNAAPGLTGLWQVSGKNKTTFAEMIQMDIAYSKRQCLWLDLKIMLKTIPALLEQVWDNRKRKAAVSRSTQSRVVVSARP